jgi:hypothetical protein
MENTLLALNKGQSLVSNCGVQAMGVIEKVTLEELRATVSGSAYVDELVVEGGQTVLTVVAPGERLAVAVPALPDTAAYLRPDWLTTVLAVQIRHGRGVLDCHVLGSAPGYGPKRVAVTIEQALAAARSGIRTVLVSSASEAEDHA